MRKGVARGPPNHPSMTILLTNRRLAELDNFNQELGVSFFGKVEEQTMVKLWGEDECRSVKSPAKEGLKFAGRRVKWSGEKMRKRLGWKRKKKGDGSLLLFGATTPAPQGKAKSRSLHPLVHEMHLNALAHRSYCCGCVGFPVPRYPGDKRINGGHRGVITEFLETGRSSI
ncbi:hypothetical protein C8R44DRAFT_744853 [Mycena epipterygia]|nr:hypothetical protein C8R44DRAFT_744853 [Mycena epipterygia]